MYLGKNFSWIVNFTWKFFLKIFKKNAHRVTNFELKNDLDRPWNLQFYYYVLRKLNFSKIYLTKIFPILFKFWHMIFYIIFYFWQEYHTFLLIFCEKKFHESIILLQKLKIRLSIKYLLPGNFSTKKWFRSMLEKKF